MPADFPPHLRIARPTADLAPLTEFYTRGLALSIIARFENHDGFDGVMLGREGWPYHLEFTKQVGHDPGRAPSLDHLLVFYLPDPAEHAAAAERLIALGNAPVAPANPYWGRAGLTFEDPDGYRIVLANHAWA